MLLQLWEPLGELRRMDHMLSRFWEEFGRPRRHWFRLFGDGVALPVDLFETPDAVVVRTALPGLRPEEIDITITEKTLTIKAEHKTEEEPREERYLLREWSQGRVGRIIALPDGLDTDKAEASYEHGVLTVQLPKTEQVKPKSVKVTVPKSIEGSSKKS